MTTLETPKRLQTPSARNPYPSPPPARRNRSRIALGTFVILVMSLLFAAAYSNVGQRRAVLVVARPVTAGSVITAADLREVRVSADPTLRPVRAENRRSVVGRVAGVDLVPGTLVTRRQLATGPALPAGRAIVGLALKAGQLPSGLRAGDAVLVVLVPPAGAAGVAPDSESAVLDDVRVAAVGEAEDAAGATVVSVNVPAADAAAVATAGADGRVSLVKVGGAS